jgi:membrane protein implicated in regulation of membrane protease activity
MKNYVHINQIITLAIVGDIAFMLWITFNAIDEGFSGTAVQLAAYIGLMLLLALNAWLLTRYRRSRSKQP